MSKKYPLIISILLAALMLCACGGNSQNAAAPEQTAAAQAEKPSPSVSPDSPIVGTALPEAAEEKPEPEKPGAVYTIYASEGWDNAGYTFFKCEESGTYEFVPSASENITWRVYVLDEMFPDVLRYLGQAYSYALEGAGSLEISAGQYVYVYSSVNSFTGEEARDDMFLAVYRES